MSSVLFKFIFMDLCMSMYVCVCVCLCMDVRWEKEVFCSACGDYSEVFSTLELEVLGVVSLWLHMSGTGPGSSAHQGQNSGPLQEQSHSLLLNFVSVSCLPFIEVIFPM